MVAAFGNRYRTRTIQSSASPNPSHIPLEEVRTIVGHRLLATVTPAVAAIEDTHLCSARNPNCLPLSITDTCENGLHITSEVPDCEFSFSSVWRSSDRRKVRGFKHSAQMDSICCFRRGSLSLGTTNFPFYDVVSSSTPFPVIFRPPLPPTVCSHKPPGPPMSEIGLRFVRGTHQNDVETEEPAQIIVGASVAGLASAIALKTSGHNVLVLEKDTQLGGASSGLNGCSRVPPNGCKILSDWGLEAEAKAYAAKMNGFSFHKYDEESLPGQDLLALNRFDPEMLTEARGGYMQFRHQDLLRMLYNAAIQPPSPTPEEESPGKVSVIFGAEAVGVDCDACSVTLRSGEVHTGDVIIGADGASGVVRQALMREEHADPEDDTPTGMAMYAAIIPRKLVLEHDLHVFCDGELGGTVWMGSGRGSMTCNVGKADDITLWVYTPDEPQDGGWTAKAEKNLADVIGTCDEQIRKLAALAGQATCVEIKKPYQLESWVSESGRVLALGDAAHPFPVDTKFTLPTSHSTRLLEAGGIPFLFSRARRRHLPWKNILTHSQSRPCAGVLCLTAELCREGRCTRIREMEKEYIDLITMSDDEMRAERDAGMRANHAAGRNAMDGDLGQMLEDFRMVFGYDAKDDADEWWINWGRLRDSPSGKGGGETNRFSLTAASFSSFTTHEETYEADVFEDEDLGADNLAADFIRG
ncbi:hypothetical protein DFH07DRAFT_938604 [Mycena maculata]|uniref:FAD-binding domain-containing protein n=1 Tax=Mycena maculata TaxID=230809 RepID=A0AAD7JLD5_9AGAR|nr:hypothetical protein DFH07DRAFT_938604 [Mycena maculata]